MRRSDPIFFLSGAAALVDQVAWARLAGRVLGSDSGGVTLVLAVFMAGLGGGALFFSRAARRAVRPERTFLLVQLGVALWTAASGFVMESTPPVDGFLARGGLAALFLLPPTLGMGATFPLMGRLTIRSSAGAGDATARFYGANTLGAAAGALLGPFLLLPTLGLRGALIAGALLDATAGVLAARMLAGAPVRTEAPTESPVAATRRALPLSRPLAVTALLGCCALALEVLLTRLLVSVTGASVYAFGIVLAVFLLGIGYGSRRVASGRAPDPRSLARLALAVAPLTVLGLLLLRFQLRAPDLFGSLSNLMPPGTPLVVLWSSHALYALLALLGPALCLGAALPLVVARQVDAGERSAESWLGWTYAWNTAGSLLGALVAGFVLLPRIGPAGALFVALGLALVAGWIAPGVARREAVAATLLAVGLGAWLATPRGDAPEITVLARHHGPFSSAAVEEHVEPDGSRTRSLRVDGKVVATSAPVDLRLQRLLGAIPGHVHGEVRSALVIGLGTGMTAGALLDLPALSELHVFEISSAVRDCAHAFAEWNGDLLADPRTTVRLVDGRHALARSDRTYDLITSDPIHPWTRGSSDLYSLEHFRNVAAHLAPGGVASQWLPLYQLSTADVETILATWAAAFPHVQAWLTGYDLALVGSNDPLPSVAEVAARPLPPAVARSLAETGVHGAVELGALLVAEDAALRARAGDTPPMRDDRPRLEFSAPRSYLAGYSTEILAWAARPESLEPLPEAARPRGREVRALLSRFLEQLPSGMSRAVAEYGRALVELPPAGG